MYNEFCIDSVITVLPLRKIQIKTNFTIDAGTVDHSTVRLVRISDASLEEYKIDVSEKIIELTLKNDLEQDNVKFMLIIRKIKDKLGRTLSAPFNKEISFEPAYKKILKIVSPSDGTTLRSLDVDIKLEAASEETEESKHRIEVSSDMAFFNVTNSILIDEFESRLTLPKDGQYYMRARAESEDSNCFGLWSDVNTFNVSTYLCDKDNSKENSFLEDIVFNDNLFVDEEIPLETEYITPNFTVDTPFTIELNKNLQFPEEREGDFDIDATPPPECEIPEPQPPKEEEFPFIDDDTKHIVMKIKAYQHINKKRYKTDVYLYATSDYPNTIELYRPGKINFEPDCIYEFNIPRLSFEDNTYETIGKIKYITEQSKLLINIDDVKALMHGLKIDDEILLNHILSASEIARYWASSHGDIELDKETLKDEAFYPFYMFIKYRSVYESLLEFYMIAATNPIKFKDALSDLSREEEYDLSYLKGLLDDFEREADEWLDMIVTTTADPQWTVRARTARAVTLKFSKPYHQYPVNGYSRGGYNR